ncbi:MAG: hypothetical protein IPP37_07105 [Saprospiraceae bacterium]|nr:hypothetical protein [Saprospiraceae bacterium]
MDSDVDGGNGASTTGLVTFTSGQTDLTWYAGLYKCVQIGERVWYDVDRMMFRIKQKMVSTV